MKSDYELSYPWKVNYLTCRDGTKIRYALYSKVKKPKFALVFINGRNEFIEKYNELPSHLQIPPSTAFLTWDHRGQGATNFKLGHIDSYDQYVDDAHHIIEKSLGKIPYVIMAHSMGSLISLYGVTNHKLSPQKLILFSPFLGFPIDKKFAYILHSLIDLFVALGFSRKYWPFFMTIKDFSLNALTHSKEKFERLLKAPYVSHSMTLGWLHQSNSALKYVWDIRNIAKLKCPIQILVAENDKVVSKEAIQGWVQKAKKYRKNIKVKVVKKAKHEILNDDGQIYQQALKVINASII